MIFYCLGLNGVFWRLTVGSFIRIQVGYTDFVTGDKWRKTRKMLTPAFHFGILDSFLDTFNKNGRVFCEVMETRVGESNFNVMDLVKMCALDNVSGNYFHFF